MAPATHAQISMSALTVLMIAQAGLNALIPSLALHVKTLMNVT